MGTSLWFILGAAAFIVDYVWSETQEHQLSLKRCCPFGQGLMSNLSCVPHDGEPIHISVEFGSLGNTSEVTLLDGQVWNYRCPEREVTQHVRLDRNTFINHLEGTNFLRFISPTGEEKMEESFCVASSADPGGHTEGIAIFCYDASHIQWRDDKVACENATCIRKCCPEGMIFGNGCESLDTPISWTTQFYSSEDFSTKVQEPSDLTIVYGFPSCSLRLMFGEYEHRLLDSGDVYTSSEMIPVFNWEKYCIVSNVDNPEGIQDAIFACYDENDNYCQTRHLVVDFAFPIISCIFIVLNWLIFVAVAKYRTSNYGWCVIAFITSLFIATLAMLINRNQGEVSSGFQCTFIGTLNHLGLLASFFWLNVLCFHVWNGIRMGGTSEGRLIYLWYSLYGWGLPLVIALVGAHVPSDPNRRYQLEIPRADYLPTDCWFKDMGLRSAYVYGFMLGLLLLNIFFVTSTLVMVLRDHKPLQDMQYGSGSLKLNLKLVVIMGITWLVEMIPWMIGVNACELWVSILDGIVALNGFYVFMVTLRVYRNIFKIFGVCTKTKYDVARTSEPNAVELTSS